MRFTCCLNMGYNLKILKTSLIIYTESVAALTDHYVDIFVWENFARVMMFENLTQKPFCLEKISVRKWYFNVLAVFSVGFWLESGKICKNIMITHYSFHALTLARPLGRCLKTRPNGRGLKQLPRDLGSVNACKKHV